MSAEKAGTSGTGSDAYSYDPNGNLVETARYRFAYDWADRLVRVTEKARTALVGTGAERKEIWLGSETDSGTALPPSDPPPVTDPPPADVPPADTGTSSGTETPPADAGTSSGTEVPPADTGSGSADASSGTIGTGAGTQSGTTDTGTGSGGTSTGSTDSGTGTDSGSGSSETSSGATGGGSGTDSGTGSETGSGTEAGTGGTSSGSTETQSGTTSSGSTDSGATASGTTESGPTVTEISYPERLAAEYSYDALGRRVSKTLADRVVSYSYDGQRIVEETVSDLSGTVLRSSEFAYGPAGDDDVIAEFRTQSGATVALHFVKDRLGSTAAVTDGGWNVLEEYRYSAFGSPYRKLADGTWEALGTETETLSGTVRPEPLTDRLYAGREWDSETGLHHYHARTYSPELGRFLQRDPAWQSDQANPYAYVRNDPANFTDPTGTVSDSTKTRLWGAAKIGLGFGQSLAGGGLTLAGVGACSTGVGCVAGAPAVVYGVDQVVEGQALVSDGVRQLWSGGEVSQATDFATRFNPVSWGLNKTGLGCESKAIVKTGIDLAAGFGTRAIGKWALGVKSARNTKLATYPMRGVKTPGFEMGLHNLSGKVSIGGKKDGVFDFIAQDGKIKTGLGHSFLSNGGSVNYAGTLSLKDGAISSWTNNSGHYMPRAADSTGLNHTIELFDKQFGVRLNIDDFRSINY